MEIKLYDKVKLKTGEEATIVEIYEPGKEYMADIDYATGTETEDIQHSQIEKVLK